MWLMSNDLSSDEIRRLIGFLEINVRDNSVSRLLDTVDYDQLRWLVQLFRFEEKLEDFLVSDE